jgi:methionine-rich copper-binding protein CopC
MVVSPADRRGTAHRPARGWRRAWAIVLISVVAGCLGAVVSAGPAQADALVASEPGVRQELDEAPGWVTLAFAAEVDPSVAKVLVIDAGGRNLTTGSLIVEGTNVTTQLQDGLKPGTYTVRYRVNGPDGEPEGGAYQFAFGAGNFGSPPEQTWTGRAEEPEAMNDPDPNAVTPGSSATAGVPEVEVEQQGSSEPTSDPGSSASDSASTSASGEPTAGPSRTGEQSATAAPPSAAPGAGLDMPPWPVWLALGTLGLFLIVAALAFLRSRR